MERLKKESDPPLKEAGIRAEDFRIFWDFVDACGGDVPAMQRGLSADPAAFDDPDAVIPFRLTSRLLDWVGARLDHPAFGLELGAKPEALGMFGPLRVALQNARSLDHACAFYTDYIQSYCSPFKGFVHHDEAVDRMSVNLDVLSRGPCPNTQGIENFLMLVSNLLRAISPDDIRPREIWFRHQPISPIEVYCRHFGQEVRFGKPTNAIRFSRSDFERARPESNCQLFELASHFIRHEYRPCTRTVTSQVRNIIRHSLDSGDCTPASAASGLGMLPRTLQRRLQEEGASFEGIKDELRRELALRYLSRSEPLTEIAAMLGYSESSVLTRSCYRWFANSPRNVRNQLRMENGLPDTAAV